MAEAPKHIHKAVLKHHARTGGGACFREEAEPVAAEAGHQIGWRCCGCQTPYSLDAPQIRRRYRGRTLAELDAKRTATGRSREPLSVEQADG